MSMTHSDNSDDLSTTEDYTGVVGGGDIEGQRATQDDEDNIEVRWGGITDAFGEIAATYTAGFAAKTALIIAKDLTTGDVGCGWLNTYIASTIAIELTPTTLKGATDLAVLRLTADPKKLTADGRSTSRIRAYLTEFNGNPIEGARIAFNLGNDNFDAKRFIMIRSTLLNNRIAWNRLLVGLYKFLQAAFIIKCGLG